VGPFSPPTEPGTRRCVSERAVDPSLLRSAPSHDDRTPLEPPRRGVVVALESVVLLVVASWGIALLERFMGLGVPLSTVESALRFVACGVILASAVFWGRWQLAAARNARRMSREVPRHSPAWGFAAFFVPGFNFVVPFRAVVQIRNASLRRALRTPPGLLATLWWSAFVLGPVAALVTQRAGAPRWAALVLSAGHLTAALAARQLVGEINQAQSMARRAPPT